MDYLQRINDALDYIENNLDGEIDYELPTINIPKQLISNVSRMMGINGPKIINLRYGFLLLETKNYDPLRTNIAWELLFRLCYTLYH